MITDCVCELAGFCARHQLKKNAHWHALCKSDAAYFRAWEQGKGPGQQVKTDAVLCNVTYNHWMPLHNYAPKNWDVWSERAARAWYRQWLRGLPKTGCGCAESWKKEVAEIPVDFSSPQAFFEWAWRIHDAVNQRLGKPTTTIEEAYQLWLPARSLRTAIAPPSPA
jgi:hypothetical protein